MNSLIAEISQPCGAIPEAAVSGELEAGQPEDSEASSEMLSRNLDKPNAANPYTTAAPMNLNMVTLLSKCAQGAVGWWASAITRSLPMGCMSILDSLPFCNRRFTSKCTFWTNGAASAFVHDAHRSDKFCRTRVTNVIRTVPGWRHLTGYRF